jgi:hypothetical protein
MGHLATERHISGLGCVEAGVDTVSTPRVTSIRPKRLPGTGFANSGTMLDIVIMHRELRRSERENRGH